MAAAASEGLVNRTIFTQDNLYVMRGLESNTFDLIYLDPPFNSKRQYSAPIESKAEGAAFKDTWKLSDVDVFEVEFMEEKHPKIAALIKTVGVVNGDADQSYLTMMASRLIEMRRLLKPTGSLYLHCDQTMSYGLKLLLDATFGGDFFRNEIVWGYRTGGVSRKRWPAKHDTILVFGKNHKTYHAPLQERVYYDKKFFGVRTDEHGRFYTDVFVRDVWDDIPAVINVSKERTGYPTQKPLKLLERIIAASCPKDGWVLDPFCGCATTCVASERQNRNWVGIDLSERAAELVIARFQNELGLWEQKQGLAHRKDIPKRTRDLVKTPKAELKKYLYGEQSGYCKGCNKHFEIQHLQIDHIIPKNKGGHDGDSNKQLLCGHCNSVKGNRSDAYLKSRQVKPDTHETPSRQR